MKVTKNSQGCFSFLQKPRIHARVIGGELSNTSDTPSEMEIRLSSTLTIFFKFVTPPVMVIAHGFMFWLFITHGDALIASIGCLVLAFLAIRQMIEFSQLQTVYYGPGSIILLKNKKKITISINDIESVFVKKRFIVKIRLKPEPSRRIKQIVYMKRFGHYFLRLLELRADFLPEDRFEIEYFKISK